MTRLVIPVYAFRISHMEIGISNPDVRRRHLTRQRLFYYRLYSHVRIMAGWQGRFGAPVPF
ncbi:hypothetical protein NTL15_003866 [Salmonella enterica]|nr:hypothetical protein [Salmonella enterica]